MSTPSQHEDHPDVVSRNARYGLVLFAVYVAMYGGFIAQFPYLFDMLEEELGFHVTCPANTIEIADRRTGEA